MLWFKGKGYPGVANVLFDLALLLSAEVWVEVVVSGSGVGW